MTERLAPPHPHSVLRDEGGLEVSWLQKDWSKQAIIEEHDYLTEESLIEVWMGCRWTTDEERADPDQLCDLFGDFESSGIDTSVCYWRAKPEFEGAYPYWTIDP